MSTVKDIKLFLETRDDNEPVAWMIWTRDDFPEPENTPLQVVEDTLELLHESDSLVEVAYEYLKTHYEQIHAEFINNSGIFESEYWQGFIAYSSYVPVWHNPYPNNTGQWWNWHIGWGDAEDLYKGRPFEVDWD